MLDKLYGKATANPKAVALIIIVLILGALVFGVFKVNNNRAWEWAIEFGKHGGDRYIPVELQRNFSKDAAVSVEYHFWGREKGFEFKYLSTMEFARLLIE